MLDWHLLIRRIQSQVQLTLPRYLSIYPMLRLLTATGLALVLLASPHTLAHALAPICGNVIKGGGCIRYVEGYDVTGTTTEVDLFFPEVASVCDCIKACYKRGSSCANFVYKFTTPSKHRSCTLYSNFNLPPSVTIGFNKRRPRWTLPRSVSRRCRLKRDHWSPIARKMGQRDMIPSAFPAPCGLWMTANIFAKVSKVAIGRFCFFAY